MREPKDLNELLDQSNSSGMMNVLADIDIDFEQLEKDGEALEQGDAPDGFEGNEIGRASCRERVFV